MDKLLVKYRIWGISTVPPHQIKLEIPGWSGEPNEHKNGDKPQPWHCIPFVEASTYGLSLNYPFETTCHVKNINGKIVFEGDFSKEQKLYPSIEFPPFMCFAPGHFGMTSSLDIKVPSGYVLRTEPHPNYYTDTTNSFPCCIPGHIQTEWWPKIFFVVFKNPSPEQTIIFEKGKPYGQALIVPKKINYDIQEMNPTEILDRIATDEKIAKYYKYFVKNNWYDNQNQNFNDKYKILSTVFSKNKNIKQFIDSIAKESEGKIKFKSKLIIKKKK